MLNPDKKQTETKFETKKTNTITLVEAKKKAREKNMQNPGRKSDSLVKDIYQNVKLNSIICFD